MPMLLKQFQRIQDKMTAILDTAEAEKRDLTESRIIEYRKLEDAQTTRQGDLQSGPSRRSFTPRGAHSGVRPYGIIGADYRKLFYGSKKLPIPKGVRRPRNSACVR